MPLLMDDALLAVNLASMTIHRLLAPATANRAAMQLACGLDPSWHTRIVEMSAARALLTSDEIDSLSPCEACERVVRSKAGAQIQLPLEVPS